MTHIESNGSKWAGQKPDSISKLIQVLKTNIIESRFFAKYKKVCLATLKKSAMFLILKLMIKK